jgi:hypothetical protein
MRNITKLGGAIVLMAAVAGVAGPARADCGGTPGFVGQVVNCFVPGAGTMGDQLFATWKGVPGFNGTFRPANPPSSAPAQPVAAPPPPPPILMPAVGSAVGNFCTTPVGRFGPGIPNSLGASCWIQGPFGLVFGQITQ